MQIFHKKNEGFTLIELIIVIAVLGILASIAIPRIIGIDDRVKDSNIAQVAGAIRTAMEVYYQDNDSYPDEDIIDEWVKLNNVLDILELRSLEDYNISSFAYELSDSESYKIELVSISTAKTYLISKNGFNEESGD
jgi:general secretion pathway protein G